MSYREKGIIETGDGHTLSWYAFGNPDAVPVLFLHGGPGAGFNPKRTKDLAPLLSKMNFITFDQRGSGNSLPLGSIENNTPENLVADIELLRTHLDIYDWLVSGTSWGTALAILYAKKYPQHCKQLLLASLFLARRVDRDWTFAGVREFFEDAFLDIETILGAPQGCNLLEVIQKNLISEDFTTNQKAAFALSFLGSITGRLHPLLPSLETINEHDIDAARLMIFYASNDFFLDPVYGVLEGSEPLLSIPISVVHGRFDMSCHVNQVFLLKKILPHANVKIVQGSHSTSEEPMTDAFIKLFAEQL